MATAFSTPPVDGVEIGSRFRVTRGDPIITAPAQYEALRDRIVALDMYHGGDDWADRPALLAAMGALVVYGPTEIWQMAASGLHRLS